MRPILSSSATRRIFLVILVVWCAPAAADDRVTQFWPEVDAFYALNPDARLLFSVAPVREVSNGRRSDLSDVDYGASADIGLFPIGRARRQPGHYDDHRLTYLRFRTGLHYLNVTGDDAKSEWRVVAELTPRAVLPLDLHLAFRNRFDLRWIHEEYSWRYRPRLWLEREFKAGAHLALVPYTSAEIFWDSRRDDWVRTRYEAGIAVAVNSWFVPEIYWGHQIDDGSGGDTITDALGITLALYF